MVVHGDDTRPQRLVTFWRSYLQSAELSRPARNEHLIQDDSSIFKLYFSNIYIYIIWYQSLTFILSFGKKSVRKAVWTLSGGWKEHKRTSTFPVTCCRFLIKSRTTSPFFRYTGPSYDLLRKCLGWLFFHQKTSEPLDPRNCCHFADVFCQRLGAGGIPAWVGRPKQVLLTKFYGKAMIEVTKKCRKLCAHGTNFYVNWWYTWMYLEGCSGDNWNFPSDFCIPHVSDDDGNQKMCGQGLPTGSDCLAHRKPLAGRLTVDFWWTEFESKIFEKRQTPETSIKFIKILGIFSQGPKI